MKKVYTLVAATAIALTSFAQNINGGTADLKEATPFKKSVNSSKATNSFYIDYDYAEEQLFSGSYQRFIWSTNTNDSTGGVSMVKAIVAFDSIFDPYGFATYVPGTDYQNISVDSIFMVGGHENNSGTSNAITFKIIGLDNSGYPQENNILWQDSVTTTTSLSNPDWLNSMVVNVAPGHVMPATQKWGVEINYRGAATDTFGLLAGFVDNGASGQCNYVALPSLFFANIDNSFTGWWSYYGANGILPTSGGGDVYYDCNQSGSFDAGDSQSYIQNWGIWVHVTTDPSGVEELSNNGLTLGQNMPNPTTGVTTVNYSLENAASVSVDVYDVAGKKVMTVAQGNKVAGNHKVSLDLSNLNSGIYYYTLTADNNSLTKKLVLTK